MGYIGTRNRIRIKEQQRVFASGGTLGFRLLLCNRRDLRLIFKMIASLHYRVKEQTELKPLRLSPQSQSLDYYLDTIRYSIMKLQISSAILLWVLCDLTRTAEAWIPTQLATRTSASATHRSTFACATAPFFRTGQGPVIGIQLYSSTNKGDSDKNVNSSSSSNASDDGEDYGDEEECADEEECGIDWSKMPGGDEEPVQAQASASSTSHGKQGTESTAKIQNDNNQIQDDEEDDEHVPNPLAPIQVRNLRLRMEMQWQMTEAAVECDVYIPSTCGSDPCQDCNGQGFNECRFCRGTTVLWMRQPGGASEGNNNNDESSFTACKICQQGTERCRSCQGSGWVSGWAKLQLSK
jgi:hypothetical protein